MSIDHVSGSEKTKSVRIPRGWVILGLAAASWPVVIGSGIGLHKVLQSLLG